MQKQKLLIFNILLNNCINNDDKIAVVEGNTSLSYKQLLDHVINMSQALLGAGVKPGNRIATLAPPCIEYWICFLASTAIGSQWLGLNPKHTKREYDYYVRDAAPSIIFTFSTFDGRNYTEELEKIICEANLNEECRIIEFGGNSFDIQSSIDSLVKFGEPASKKYFFDTAKAVQETDTAAIVYTSGSTGTPKGALLSHQAMCRCADASASWMGTALEKAIIAFPINHIGSLNALGMNVFNYGGTIYFLKQFRIKDIVELGKQEGVTFSGHNQTTFQMMLESFNFSITDLSTLKLLVHGGSKTDIATLSKFRILDCNISSVYAQTESCGYVLRSEFSASLDVMANTIGKPVPGITARIRARDDTHDLNEGEVGELQLHGNWLFSGYLNNQSATEAAFTKDGFLRTGDLCLRRPDGNYEFVERINNTYKSGGYNIYPAEIETVILEHPKVCLAAVIPVDHPRFGKVGFGFVTPHPKEDLDYTELKEYLRRELANYKIPKKLRIMESLPTLSNKKIDRQALKEIADGDA